ANPGKLNMASAGIGGPQHIAGEVFKFMAGVNLTHIAFKGSTPAVGHFVPRRGAGGFDVQPPPPPLPHPPQRPPTCATPTPPPAGPRTESVTKGYEPAGWIGSGSHKDTPPEIIATLNKQTNAAVLDPTIKQRFADLGAVAVPPNSPEEFAKFIAENIDKWTK